MPITSFPPARDVEVTRDDLAKSLGLEDSKNWRGGIIALEDAKKVLVFSDPEEGIKYGYTFDGWAEEEDEHGPVYLYTGAGRSGDQSLKDKNAPLLSHPQKGRELHLFVRAGKVAGTDTKTHRYVGQMVIDPIAPWVQRTNNDQDGNPRLVYVFRFRPAQGAPAVEVHDVDVTPAATADTRIWVPAQETTATFTDAEVHATDTTTVGPQGPRIVRRREGVLRTLFAAHLKALGHEVGTYQLSIKGERGTFTTDLYDRTENVLYEAKGNSKRKAVREAVAQLLDYRRHIDAPGLQGAVLLPSEPSEDLRDYIAQAGFLLVYKDSEGFAGYPLT